MRTDLHGLPPLSSPESPQHTPHPPGPQPEQRAQRPQHPQRPHRPTGRFMVAHPARWLAMGLGSGLSPKAPGTVGTLWAWASFLVLDPFLGPWGWATLIALSCAVGVWACTRTAQHLGIADPGAIVWDEIVAFWLVLWLVMPAAWWVQALAFALFRFFDAVKPGPVAWADSLFKAREGGAIGWKQGLGILLDDLVAALCTLVVLALGVQAWPVAEAWWRG